jgi:hypothetical protein
LLEMLALNAYCRHIEEQEKKLTGNIIERSRYDRPIIQHWTSDQKKYIAEIRITEISHNLTHNFTN